MKTIPQFQPWFDGEYEALKECFDANWITEGPQAAAFLEELRDYIDTPYAVFAPNGTLALYLGLKALGIGEGDEVLVPDFTFIGSATSIEMAGATPIFCDVDAQRYQIDLNHAGRLVNAATTAIMPVHMYGAMVDMDAVLGFADEHNLLVIEDAAQTIGIRRRGQHAGTFGDVGCFSFFADKSLTTGEGGLVVTADADIYDRLRYLRNQGRLDRGSYVHPELGYNFRMTDLQCAVGRVQLRRQPEIVGGKLRVLERYCEGLAGLPLRILDADKDTTHIPIRVSIVVDSARSCETYLRDRGVETRTFYFPLHRQPAFEWLEHRPQEFPNANSAYDHGLMLPSYPTLSDEDVEYVCDQLKSYCEGGRA